MYKLALAALLVVLPGSAQDTLLETQKLTAADALFLDNFGRDVSVRGSDALITAFADDDMGSATLFAEVGGVWVEGQKLQASDGVIGDRFGLSGVLLDDTILIGAEGAETTGTVYVFEPNGTLWTEVDELRASDGAPGDYFGGAIDADGGVLIVGADSKDDVEQDAGAAYVFTKTGSTWSEAAKLSPPSPELQAGFGWAVAATGDVVVVTAASQDAPANDSGAAYVYRRTGSAWPQEQMLTASDADAGEYFGWAAAAEGNLIAIAAYRDGQPVSAGGAVYVFRHDGSAWVEETKLTPASVQASDRFGWSVAVDGNRLVGGAAAYPAGFGDGALYEFQYDGVQWHELHRMLSSDTSVGFFDPDLGLSVDVDGPTIFGGAPWGDSTELNTGAVYVFEVDSVSTYCTAKTSSAGCTSNITTSDLANQPVSGADDYDVRCLLAQGAKNGLVFAGISGPAGLPFSGGILCVNPPTKRGPVSNSGGTTPTSCDGAFSTRTNDGNVIPSGLDAGPGNSAWYQYWYRDPQGGAGNLGTALSNALQLDSL